MNSKRPLCLSLVASLWCAFAVARAEDTPAPSPAAPFAAPSPETTPAPAAAPDQIAAPPAELPPPVPAAPAPRPKPHVSIEIDVRAQRAYLLRDSQRIAESPVSTGRPGHLTPTGDFEVVEKDENHSSSLYGSIVSASGRIVRSGADYAMPVPKGCHFERAPMKFFLRFDGAAGTHAGVLPGYPASHGCVRMPLSKAKLFYDAAEIGSPVHVFGSIPDREPERLVIRVAARAQAVNPPPAPAAPAPPTVHSFLGFHYYR